MVVVGIKYYFIKKGEKRVVLVCYYKLKYICKIMSFNKCDIS